MSLSSAASSRFRLISVFQLGVAFQLEMRTTSLMNTDLEQPRWTRARSG